MKTHCKRGHEFTPENTYTQPAHPDRKWVSRACKACMYMKKREWALANPEKVQANVHNMRQHRAAWRMRNPTYHRDKSLMDLYGLTWEQVIHMLKEQGGVCAICKLPTDKPNVDHCHKSGKVRGILCPQCNVGIGNLKDDPNILEEAARYVREYAAQ